ncbi:hypothetical protein [Ornithinimicrobium murale]|uniref:hypothetical protein n=1 Tax=Ornithinimicrobium murale TaxID=1050153 RepID=UPI000E0D81A2|nr:hypothetical protein [Ornithinimicrobium murale]
MLDRIKEAFRRAAVRALKALALLVVFIVVLLLTWWALSSSGVVPSIAQARAELDDLMGGVDWRHVVGFLVAAPLVLVVVTDLLDEFLGTGSYDHRDDRWDDRNR